MHAITRTGAALALLLAAGACGPSTSATGEPERTRTPAATPSPSTTATPEAGSDGPPEWLGSRVLPERPDGFGEVRPTPPELRDRRFTIDHLPSPSDDAFHGSISAVPPDVLERSTWSEECPVGADELSYLRVTFWGFDERPHTGELLVHAFVATDVLGVFERLYELRFPIEEMRVVDAPELDAPPTGDGNNTTAFVCRPVAGGTSWSEHARGRAIDLNPFHNPYVRGDLVLPELASAYTDRSWERSGMVTPEVVEAFRAIGWGWGGGWSSPDWMHFSSTGR